MLFKRALITAGNNGGLPERLRAGGGLLANLSVTAVATNTDQTMTVAQMAGGLVSFTSFSAGRAVTTPTAALILAAAPDMDIGDSFSFIVSAQAAFAATWVAGDGVTLAGRATTPASSFSIVTVTKTAAAAVTWHVA